MYSSAWICFSISVTFWSKYLLGWEHTLLCLNLTSVESWSICFSAVLQWIMHDRGRKSVATVLVLLALPLSWPNTLCSLVPLTEELFPAQEPIPVCDMLYLKKKNHAKLYKYFFPKLILFHNKSTLFLYPVIPPHFLWDSLYTTSKMSFGDELWWLCWKWKYVYI